MIHSNPLTMALAGALALSPAAAFAQDTTTDTAPASIAKRFAIVGGYALGEPTNNPSVGDSRMQVDGDGAATLSASYYVTDNIVIEGWGAADKFGHRVNVDGQKAGSVEAQPYALSGQYHFGQSDQIVRPYLGLGYYQTNYDSENTEPSGDLGGQRLSVDTPSGAMATAGVDVNITPTWFARADVRYMDGDSDVKLDGQKVGDAELNPVVLGVGIGARF